LLRIVLGEALKRLDLAAAVRQHGFAVIGA
jgi:hypothetical protein